MKVIDRYLLKETLKTYLFSLFIIVIIFFILHFLEEIGRDYDIKAKFLYLAFSIPQAVYNFYLIGLLISIVIVISSFNEKKELHIFLTSGLSVANLVKKISIIGFLISIFSTLLGEIITPYFTAISLETKAVANNQIFIKSNKDIWTRSGSKFLNIGENLDQRIKNLYILDFDKDKNLQKLIFSNQALLKDGSLHLNNPEGMEIDYSGKKFPRVVTFNNHNKTEYVSVGQTISHKKDYRVMNILELFETITYLNSNKINANEIVEELLFRILKPIYLIGLILIAIPFVLSLDRKTSLGNTVFVGISISIVFYMLIRIFGVMSTGFGLSSYFLSISPSLIVIIFGIIFFKAYKKSRNL